MNGLRNVNFIDFISPLRVPVLVRVMPEAL